MKHLIIILLFASCQSPEPKLYWNNADSLEWDKMPKISLPVTKHYGLKERPGRKSYTFHVSDSNAVHFYNITGENTIKADTISIYITDSTGVWIRINGKDYIVKLKRRQPEMPGMYYDAGVAE